MVANLGCRPLLQGKSRRRRFRHEVRDLGVESCNGVYGRQRSVLGLSLYAVVAEHVRWVSVVPVPEASRRPRREQGLRFV